MSKTERDLTSPEADDALEAAFAAGDSDSSADDDVEGDEPLDGIEADHRDDDVAGGAVEGDAVVDDAVVDDDEVTEPEDDVSDTVDESTSRTGWVAPDVPDSSEVTFDVLPPIILATPDGGPPDGTTARRLAQPVIESDDEEFDDDEVSDRILEELRRADIDGPLVPHAQQDDTTTARRRPRDAADYDPAPVPIPAKVPRVLGRKPRVRKVTRVVRHVDPWSVFKIALVAHLVLYVTVLTASVLLWNVAYSTNTIDNVERFFESFGWNSFEFNGGELYRAGWIAGLFIAIGLTGLAVLAATLFNLITDLVGGVRFTVLEEEVVETRTSPMRRFVVRRSEPEVPVVIRDGSGVMIREAVVDDAGANDRPTR